MDSDFFWHSLGGGALVAAVLTLARLLLEFAARGGERRLQHEERHLEHTERHRGQQRDAEARLERILQDRLADADRRLERYEQDVTVERVRCATLEREHARLYQAYELLKEQHASLQADYARLAREARRARSPALTPPSKPFLPDR